MSRKGRKRKAIALYWKGLDLTWNFCYQEGGLGMLLEKGYLFLCPCERGRAQSSERSNNEALSCLQKWGTLLKREWVTHNLHHIPCRDRSFAAVQQILPFAAAILTPTETVRRDLFGSLGWLLACELERTMEKYFWWIWCLAPVIIIHKMTQKVSILDKWSRNLLVIPARPRACSFSSFHACLSRTMTFPGMR